MNVLLLVPDGVSVRNFLLTGLVDRLAQGATVDILVGAGLPHAETSNSSGVRTVAELAPYPERALESTVRRTVEYAHLRWCDTPGARFNLSAPIPGSTRSRMLRRLSKSASGPIAASGATPRMVRLHDRLAARRDEVAPYARLLRELGTDVVLCAHHRPHVVQPVVYAARQLGVSTATFIFSWDNLTTKGRIAAPYDHYLVWSDQMADELTRFYPEITDDRIHVVGSPQFEPYADVDLVWSRERFVDELGIDGMRPVICFSGGDTGTCPEDPEHLRILAEEIESGRIHGRPQVLLRPAPVDVSNRYEPILDRFPITMSQPRWQARGGDWTTICPDPADVELLVNLVRHSDVNVNMASTMTLDFAIHDTPVVNLGFDVDPRRRLAVRYYDFDHYRPVVEFGAARVARNREELAEAVNAYLADPSLDRAARRRFVDYELRVEPGQSIAAIDRAVQAITAA